MIRALVDTVLESKNAAEPVLPEILDLADRHGANHGKEGHQIDPISGRAIPTQELLTLLPQTIGDALERNGDTAFILRGLERKKRPGNGAQRQSRSYARGGLKRLVLDAAEEFIA